MSVAIVPLPLTPSPNDSRIGEQHDREALGEGGQAGVKHAQTSLEQFVDRRTIWGPNHLGTGQ